MTEMKGGLNNLNLSYVEAEDRILMTIATTANEEIRFWITRLYSRHLFELLSKLLLSGQSEDSAEVQRKLALERQEAVQKVQPQQNRDGDGATGSEPAPEEKREEASREYPMGKLPILLTKLSAEQQQDSGVVLKMHPSEGVGIDLRVDRNLVHNLCALLTQIETQASWNLRLESPGAKAMATVTASGAIN